MSKNASEGTQNTGEGQPNSGEGDGASIQELQEQMAALKASNERLLQESKNWKQKYQSIGSEAEERERLEAEKAKDFKKQAEIERKRAADLQAKLKQRDESVLQANIKAAVAKAAPDAVDLDDLLNQPKFSHILKSGVDEESLSLSDETAKLYVAEVFKAKPHLKKASKSAATMNRAPNGRMSFDEGAPDLSKKTDAELVGIIIPGLGG